MNYPKAPQAAPVGLPTDHAAASAASYAYLPINGRVGACSAHRLSWRNQLPLLALVDAAVAADHDRFGRHTWRTDRYRQFSGAQMLDLTAQVFRRFYDLEQTRATNRRVQYPVFLAAEVLQIPWGADDRVLHLNGDRLDCRACNLITWAQLEARGVDPKTHPVVRSGSTFYHFPDFNAAYAAAQQELPELRASVPKGRRSQVPLHFLKEKLEEFVARAKDPETFGRPASYQAIADEWNAEINGVTFSPQTVRHLLLGHSLRQPRIDYALIATALPCRVSRLQRMRAGYENHLARRSQYQGL